MHTITYLPLIAAPSSVVWAHASGLPFGRHATSPVRTPSAWTTLIATGLLITLLLLSGCGGGEMLHQELSTMDSPPHSRTFTDSFEPVWGAMEKVFLAWGFRIDRLDTDDGTLIGTYLLDEDEQTTTLRLSITARPESSGTTLSASAVETRHTHDPAKTYWLFVFPRTATSNTGPVIITSETIHNPGFYQRFFNFVDKELETSRLITKGNVQ